MSISNYDTGPWAKTPAGSEARHDVEGTEERDRGWGDCSGFEPGRAADLARGADGGGDAEVGSGHHRRGSGSGRGGGVAGGDTAGGVADADSAVSAGDAAL